MNAAYGWYMALAVSPNGAKTNFPLTDCDYERAESFAQYMAARGYDVVLVQVMDTFQGERPAKEATA